MAFFGLFKKKNAKETKKAEQKAPLTNPRKEVKAEVKTENKAVKSEAGEPLKTPVGKAAQNLAEKEREAMMPKAEKAEKIATKEEVKKKEEKKPIPKKSASFAGKFEIKKSRDGKYVFNLYAANSVIVATSQIYSSSSAAQNGIKSVIENAERANIEDQTLKSYEPQNFPKWEIYIDKGNQFRFRLCAPNGSCICHSQGYTTKASCKNGIESIIKTAKVAAVDKSYLKKD